MTALADAERAVRGARRRLAAGLVVDGALRGALAGAAAGLAAAAAAWALSSVAPSALLAAAPVLGAVAGATALLRRTPDLAGAALVLDRAARTDEGFVSAIAARDASPAFREMAAAWALSRCGAGAVGRALPFEVPRVAAAAVLASAALGAVVLVQGTAGAGPAAPVSPPPGPTEVEVAAPAVSPRDRVASATRSLRAGERPSATLREDVRGDLASVPVEDLRALAEALAAGGSEEARRAADALARGDVSAAIEALRRALGGAPSAGAVLPGGTAPGSIPGGSREPVRPRTPPTWPLRYDRTVERWFEILEESK